MKEEITDAHLRARAPLRALSSEVLCRRTCAAVHACEEPVPVHINQAAVFGRVIRGVPEATFLMIVLVFASLFLLMMPSSHSRVCVCVCYPQSLKEMPPEAQTDSIPAAIEQSY